jgi:uncharacterized membrane protein
MVAAPKYVRPDSPVDRWSDESLPLGLDKRNDWPSNKRPSSSKRSSRRLVRFLITFCLGVAATLAWQSYGNVAREMIANSSPVLGWLAPQAASLAQVAPDQVTPAAPSLDLQQLKLMSLDLSAVRQSVDQLATQHQQIQQMAGDIATMQAAQQAILRKVAMPAPPPPRQATAPAHNAVQN